MALKTDAPWQLFVFSGFASCCGELATVPIDVVKVRMQLDGQGGGAKKYPSALQAFPTIVREEGFGALYKGVQPALLRQATYGSVRIGLYEPVKTGIAALLGQGGAAAGGQQQQPSFLHKALSGIVCGALSAGGFTPMDVVKIRMQADGMLPAAAAPPPAAATAASSSLAVGVGAGATHVASSARHGGSSTSAAAAAGAAAAARGVATAAAAPAVPASAAAASAKTAASAAAAAAASSVLRAPRYRNVFHAFAEIGRTEGLRGLYKGVSPTVQRAAVVAAVELSSYDECKELIVQYMGLQKTAVSTHLGASIMAGFFATVASSPLDVIKSRVMNQPCDASGRGLLYSSTIDCLRKSVKAEGALSLWKGFWPNFARLGPHCVVTFMVIEQLRNTFSKASTAH